MLLQFRHLTRGWIAGIILGVLIIAFAIWGVNDVFNGIGSAHAAKVGPYEVSPQQISRALDQGLRRQREQGANLTRADAIEGGAHLQILDQLIGQRALWAYADALRVSASHRQVAEIISEFPNVQDPITGAFSEESYNSFLQQIGYQRGEFEREIRGDVSAGMVMQALSAGLRAPASYGALALAFESERRTITLAEAPMSLAGDVPQPTDAQVQAFYEENAARLRVPEYRAVTLVFARAEDFIPRVQVAEAAIAEEFESRRASLETPERRSAIQIAAPDEAAAAAAAQRISAGEAPAAVAQALGLQVVQHQDVVRSDIPDAAIASAAFEMRVGDAPRAVRARLTPYAVVALTGVTPASSPDLAAARDLIRAELAEHEATELLNDAISAFEDARSGGAGIVEASRGAGLSVYEIAAVDSRGLDPLGAPIEQLQAAPDLLALAFETPEGEASDFMPFGEQGDVVIAVTGITPESVRPLEEVRVDLIQAWLNRERVRRLTDIAAEITEAVTGGQSFQAAVRARGLRIVAASQPLPRQSANQVLPPNLAAGIFGGRLKAVVSDMRADGGGLLIAQIEAIERTTAEQSPEQAELGRQQMQQSLGQSLIEAIQAGARDRAAPERNERLIERVFATGTDDSDNP